MSVKKEGVKPCDCQEEQIETGIGMFPNGIKYCPLHASAPILYKACKKACMWADDSAWAGKEKIVETLEQALAAAEGRA